MVTSRFFHSARYLGKKWPILSASPAKYGDRHQGRILCMTSVTVLTGQGTPSASCLDLCHSSDGRGCPEGRILPQANRHQMPHRITHFLFFWLQHSGKVPTVMPWARPQHTAGNSIQPASSVLLLQTTIARHWATRWPNHPHPGPPSHFTSGLIFITEQKAFRFLRCTALLSDCVIHKYLFQKGSPGRLGHNAKSLVWRGSISNSGIFSFFFFFPIAG